jgi:hypothetical protein
MLTVVQGPSVVRVKEIHHGTGTPRSWLKVVTGKAGSCSMSRPRRRSRSTEPTCAPVETKTPGRSQRGRTARASQVPRWPGTTTNSTSDPRAMSRLPSLTSVQWKGYALPSAPVTSPRPASLSKAETFPNRRRPTCQCEPVPGTCRRARPQTGKVLKRRSC